MDHRPKSHHQM